MVYKRSAVICQNTIHLTHRFIPTLPDRLDHIACKGLPRSERRPSSLGGHSVISSTYIRQSRDEREMRSLDVPLVTWCLTSIGTPLLHSLPSWLLGACMAVCHSLCHSMLSWPLGTHFNHLTPIRHSAAGDFLKVGERAGSVRLCGHVKLSTLSYVNNLELMTGGWESGPSGTSSVSCRP